MNKFTPRIIQQGSPCEEYELAPGVTGYAIECDDAVYIPVMRSAKPGEPLDVWIHPDATPHAELGDAQAILSHAHHCERVMSNMRAAQVVAPMEADRG